MTLPPNGWACPRFAGIYPHDPGSCVPVIYVYRSKAKSTKKSHRTVLTIGLVLYAAAFACPLLFQGGFLDRSCPLYFFRGHRQCVCHSEKGISAVFVCGQKRAFAGLAMLHVIALAITSPFGTVDGGHERCQPPVSFLVCHRRFAGLRRADVLVPHGEKRRSIHCRGRIAKPFLRFFLPEAVICGKMQDRTVKTASCLEDEGHVFTKTDFTRSLYFEIDILNTEIAIKLVKDTFERELAEALHLIRVSAPLFVRPESGLNDDLNGVERPVQFDVLEMHSDVQVVHSLAKWKRLALKRYGFGPGSGIYTDMNAIRRDEDLIICTRFT